MVREGVKNRNAFCLRENNFFSERGKRKESIRKKSECVKEIIKMYGKGIFEKSFMHGNAD